MVVLFVCWLRTLGWVTLGFGFVRVWLFCAFGGFAFGLVDWFGGFDLLDEIVG